ncbi:hypothetical protein D9M70_541180 [compost metagenome]
MRQVIDTTRDIGDLPGHGALADDAGVLLGVHHADGVGLDLTGIGQGADVVGQDRLAVTEGDHVHRLAVTVQGQDQAVEVGVLVPGEGIGRQLLAEDVDQVRLDQHGAQDAVLRFDAVQLHDAHACSSRWRNTARLQITSRRGMTMLPRK